MSSQTFPITGIPLVPGQPLPTRQEITAWYKNDASSHQVSLFMQALTAFMSIPIEERLSYFQIAGIHCYPLVGWDGQQSIPPGKSDPFPGFCAHNRVTFPTWHRPYMLLFEQVMYNNMNDIIDCWVNKGEFNDPTEVKIWRSAASQFRLPYWDWAKKQPYIDDFGVPQVCTFNTVQIVMPGGKSQTIPNPLVKFQNPKLDGKEPVAMGDSSMGIYAIKDHNPNNPLKPRPPPNRPFYKKLPWSECVATSRYGIGSDGPPDWVHGINNWQRANLGLQQVGWNAGSLADAVSRLLESGYFDSWEHFASTKWNDPKKNTNYLSIEYIHNFIHNMTGGQFLAETEIDKHSKGYDGLGLGHMSDVPVAAFDPIFWLHHCNIDRLLAIWQTFNAKIWFDEPHPCQPNPKNPLPPDPLPSDPLPPFHFDTKKNLWDSNRARFWKTLNYQYDELVPKAGVPEGSPQYLADLREHIDSLYPPTGTLVSGVKGYTSSKGEFVDYIINVVYDRYALGGLAYSILFFLGEPPEDLSMYRQSENFVGQIFTFTSPVENADGSPACGNCAQQSEAKVLSKAQIQLTLPLVRKATALGNAHGREGEYPQLPLPDGELVHITPHRVEDILRDRVEGLMFKFVTLGGERVDCSQFPNTEIAVLHGQGRDMTQPGAEGAGPAFRSYKVLKRAVNNQFLGLGHPETRLDLIKDDP